MAIFIIRYFLTIYYLFSNHPILCSFRFVGDLTHPSEFFVIFFKPPDTMQFPICRWFNSPFRVLCHLDWERRNFPRRVWLWWPEVEMMWRSRLESPMLAGRPRPGPSVVYRHHRPSKNECDMMWRIMTCDMTWYVMWDKRLWNRLKSPTWAGRSQPDPSVVYRHHRPSRKECDMMWRIMT